MKKVTKSERTIKAWWSKQMETACGNSNNNGLVKNTRKGHDAIYICVFFTGVPRKYSPKNRVNIYLVKMYKCGNDVTLTKHFVDPSSCPNRNRDYSNFLCSKPFDNINACASLYKKQLPKLKMHQRLNVKILWMHFDLHIMFNVGEKYCVAWGKYSAVRSFFI